MSTQTVFACIQKCMEDVSVTTITVVTKITADHQGWSPAESKKVTFFIYQATPQVCKSKFE